MALNITNTLTVTPKRVAEAEFGEKAPPQDLAPIEVVRLLNAPDRVGSSDAWVQTGMLYTRKGVDLEDTDLVPLPEGMFKVLGGPQLNFNHPMTGNDFGWVRWHIERVGTVAA